MKNLLTIVLLTYFSTLVSAQIKFEKGYFIKNDGARTECLINNTDWRLNPEAFDYKLTESGNTATATIQDIKEFGIYNFSKYIRFEGLMDMSSNEPAKLTENKKPDYQQVTVFLRVIVEGEASLYLYNNMERGRYFFNVNNQQIEQLIQKDYLKHINGRQERISNLQYQQQLLLALKCRDISMAKIKNIDYSTNSLKKIFVEYNTCKGADFEVILPKKDRFNLALKGSYGIQKFSINHPAVSGDLSKMGFRYGLETEFMLPFNQQKWSVVFEPTYQSFYKTEVLRAKNNFIDYNITLDYASIELPLGIRYYAHLNENSKLFASAYFVQDYSIGDANYFLNNYGLPVNPGWNALFGIGYKYKNLASFEIRGYTPRTLTQTSIYVTSKYQGLMMTLGVYIL